MASAKGSNLSISTKHSIEISKFLRNKNTGYAKKFLENVILKKEAVPFKTHKHDVGHKRGPIAAGRYPVNAAKNMLMLVKSVEANAQAKGLNVSALKITKLVANKASIPMTGGRHRYGTKRTNLDIAVQETEPALKKAESKTVAKTKNIVEVAEAAKSVEDKKAVEVIVEAKTEQAAEVKEPVKKIQEKVQEVKEEVTDKQPEGAKAEKKAQTVPKPKVQEEPVKELSSQDLLKKAQEKAAEVNKKEKEHKDVEQVTDLLQKLQQKGTLRDKKQ